MDKSLEFVVDTYLLEDLHDCYVNRRSRIHAPHLHKLSSGHRHHDHDGAALRCQNPETVQEKGQENDQHGVDRLSPLPDYLCQHIISFLPTTDARRTAFLSKRWRFLWSGCPSFTFDEREFHSRPPPVLQWYRNRQNFVSFVEEALEFRARHFDDLNIEKLKVSMRFVEELGPYLDNWIAFALKRNVKELSIVAEMKDLIAIAEFFHPFRMPYQLPKSVFSTKSIQYLELVFCDLSNVLSCIESIQLPNLKNLDMINVHMSDAVFNSILSGSPLLEKINLSLVCGPEKLHVSGEKLKMLVVFKCLPLEEVVVKAPNIESFLFRGKRQKPDKIDISSCRKLKFLWLQRASNLTDDMLEHVTRHNPCLEIMVLSHCSGLKNLIITSPKLWMFVLFKCKHLNSAKIEAPTLSAFEYSGHMINFKSVVSSPQLDAIIHMDGPEICCHWYAKLKDMCARFEHCQTLWIRCEQDIDLIVPQEMRKRLLPQLHALTELKIHVRSGVINLPQLEDGIRWIFPGLKNLYVESDGSTHHFRYDGAGAGDGCGPPTCKRREGFIQWEGHRL